MKLLVDTNILIDCFQNRQPFAKSAQKLLMLGLLGEFSLWISPSQITDAYYLLSDGGKASLAEAVREKLRLARKAVHISTLGEYDVDEALILPWDDFEDALLFQCAIKVKADAIITRNQGDFALSSIPVMNPDELFSWLCQEKGLTYDFIDW